MDSHQPSPSPVLLTAIDAVRTRRSIRAFTEEPVPRRMVEHILELASRAPSGSNIQPWQVYVIAGTARDTLSAELKEAHFDPANAQTEEYNYYPTQWFEPYLGRRRKVGWDLYSTLGIARGDKEAMSRQHARNYDFFGAPVGLFFTLHRTLEIGSWLDLGMFMENVMVVARGVGLDTCPQAAFAKYHRIVCRHLDIPDDEILVSGMALGHADRNAPENRLETERAPVAEFTRFHGF
ncbi:nitroreductase [Skermanella aerolata]|uniref:nitroreductase n=1 Tax=Skermanella aerolata TaxID=393310 RepID=UPI003D25A108